MDDIVYYTYELNRSRLPAMFRDCVAIRKSWINRTRRYALAKGLKLKHLARFINNGLYDRSEPDFNQKALDEKLTSAQMWVLTSIILSDFGVPEWLRDKDRDENAPELVVAEPEEEPSGVIAASKAVASAVTAPVVNVGAATVAGVAGVSSAVAEEAVKPVRGLAAIVSGENVEKQVESTEPQVDAVEEQVESTEPQVDAVEEQVESTEPQVDAVEEQVDSTEPQVDAVEEQVDSTEA